MILLVLACAGDPPAARAVTPAPAPVPPVAATLVAPEPGLDPAASTALVFVGDAGKGGAGQKAVADAVKAWCAARRCDFVAYLGDNLYPAGATSPDDPIFRDRFEVYWEGFDVPFYVALGNHDHMGDPQAELDYAKTSRLWRMPARWYRFEQGIAEFLVLDTGPSPDGGKVAGEQLAWLQGELARPAAPWRVAYGHHPIHSSGLHGASPALITGLEPIFRDGGVDLWLCGHDHHLEVLDDGVAPLEVISGGGSAARKVKPPVAGSVYLAPSLGFGYLVLEPGVAHLAMVEVEVGGGAKLAWRSELRK